MDFSIKTGQDLLTMFLLLAFFAMAVVLVVVVVKILMFIRKLDDDRKGVVREPFNIAKYFKRTTFSVPIEKEEEILLRHSYDGIRELDNHLPPWWLGLFYGGIVFAIVYMLAYHVWDWAPLQTEEYLTEMSEAEVEVTAYKATLAMTIDETNVEIVTDDAAIVTGKELFLGKCVACHGQNAEGGVGPNLTDGYWLHGAAVGNIFASIKYGFPEKGMIAWQSQLKPDEIQSLASYILTLQGSTPPNAKEPQGELVEPTDAAEAVKTEGVVAEKK